MSNCVGDSASHFESSAEGASPPLAQDVFRISLAVITRNRPEVLYESLASLRSQTRQPFEIVVSDDSDPDRAAETEAVARTWHCRYIPGPRRGMQANRNHAHRACKGTHIRTMDDDHEFPPNHWQVIEETVAADPTSVWVFAEHLMTAPDSLPQVLLPGDVQPRGFRAIPPNLDDCFAISDGVAIYPRAIFERHQFLEGFRYAGELEFGGRLKALGYRIRYCDRTYVIHSVYRHQWNSHCVMSLKRRSEFFGAAITYGCYLPNLKGIVECLVYYLFLAIATSTNLRNYEFNLQDYWQVIGLVMKYRALFRSGQYEQMV